MHPTRSFLAALVLAPSFALAQAPIDVEWIALRPFGSGAARIAHDAASDSYIWAVNDDSTPPNDEFILPIAADGTDLGPAYPSAFSVGSLDALTDLEMLDSVAYALMYHQNISGNPQLVNWTVLGADNDIVQEDPLLDEIANDMYVDATGIYVCGIRQLADLTSEYTGRVMRTDLQGNMLWNVLWNDDTTPTEATFSSVTVMGDSVIVADFPDLVIFNKNDGTFIGTYGPVIGNASITGPARISALGHRLYYAMGVADTLYYGNWDFYSLGGSVQGTLATEGFPTDVTGVDLEVTELGEVWISCNALDHGRLLRTDFESNPIGSIAEVYNGITDIDWANGSLSITGWLDFATSTTYVVTGTPQP